MFGNAVLFANRGNAVISKGVTPSDFTDLIAAKLATWGIVTFKRNKLPGSVGVKAVIRMISKVKVIWIDAGGIMLSRAVVKNAKAVRYRPSMQYPRQHQSANRPYSLKPAANLSVSFRICARSPQPARISLSDFGPKSLNDGWRKSLRCEVLYRYGNHVVSFARLALQGLAELFSFTKSTTRIQGQSPLLATLGWLRSSLGRSLVAGAPFPN
jgi:hypothetical protein